MSRTLQLNRFSNTQGQIFVFHHGLLAFSLSDVEARILIEKLQVMLEDPKGNDEVVVVP